MCYKPLESPRLADPALGGELTTQKQRHQDEHTEISSDTHHSVNTDNNHNTCDVDDEDPQPAKRRKPRSAHTMTPPTTTPEIDEEIDEAQSQDDHGCSSTFIDEQHCASRTSRRPSAASEAVPVAEYQEWPFQGFLKRVKIGNKTMFNLEFQLSNVPEHFHFPVHSEALGTRFNKETPTRATIPRNLVAHSEVQPATLQCERKHVPWRPEEDETIRKMKEDGCSWEEIHRALPDRTLGAIRVRYSTKIKR